MWTFFSGGRETELCGSVARMAHTTCSNCCGSRFSISFTRPLCSPPTARVSTTCRIRIGWSSLRWACRFGKLLSGLREFILVHRESQIPTQFVAMQVQSVHQTIGTVFSFIFCSLWSTSGNSVQIVFPGSQLLDFLLVIGLTGFPEAPLRCSCLRQSGPLRVLDLISQMCPSKLFHPLDLSILLSIR